MSCGTNSRNRSPKKKRRKQITCTCDAYHYPHRAGSHPEDRCYYTKDGKPRPLPDPPDERYAEELDWPF